MTGVSYPKTGVSTTEEQFSSLIEFFAGTGVKNAASLAASASGSGMNVTVSAGSAQVRGMVYSDTASATLTHAAAPASGQTRIDTIILERNLANTPNVQLKIAPGTAATTASAVAPALTQAIPGVWQEPIADVAIPGGASVITAAMITDRRRICPTPLAQWTTAKRPAHVAGVIQLGFNLTTQQWEFSNGSAWVNLTMTRDQLRSAAGIYVQSSPLTSANNVGDIRFATS